MSNWSKSLQGKLKKKEWYDKHAEQIVVAKRQRTAILRAELIAAYGGVCSWCGEDDPIVLAVDHKYDDGASERKRLGSKGRGLQFYAMLKDLGWPRDKYQLLCWNCNYRKHVMRNSHG
jgi:hypothetical protein